jgi:hypothetical protein
MYLKLLILQGNQNILYPFSGLSYTPFLTAFLQLIPAL